MPVHLTVKLNQTAPSHSNESDTRHFYSHRNRDNLNLIAILLAWPLSNARPCPGSGALRRMHAHIPTDQFSLKRKLSGWRGTFTFHDQQTRPTIHTQTRPSTTPSVVKKWEYEEEFDCLTSNIWHEHRVEGPWKRWRRRSGIINHYSITQNSYLPLVASVGGVARECGSPSKFDKSRRVGVTEGVVDVLAEIRE